MGKYMAKKYFLIQPFSHNFNGKGNAKNYPWWDELIQLIIEEIEIIKYDIAFQKKPDYHCMETKEKITSIYRLYPIAISDPKNEPLKRVRTYFNIPHEKIIELAKNAEFFISIDSFLQHLIYCEKINIPGFVIWGKSDPKIFGYQVFHNILKSEKYLRKNQYLDWKNEKINHEVFLKPKEIIKIIQEGKNIKPSDMINFNEEKI